MCGNLLVTMVSVAGHYNLYVCKFISLHFQSYVVH